MTTPVGRRLTGYRRILSPDDARIIDFALQWARFGGGDEYILPEFGVQPAEYYRRMLVVLQAGRAPRMDAAERQLLVALCVNKLEELSGIAPTTT
jgi:hypothetical protein